MNAQEKLKEVQAEEELNARGYRKKDCTCIGGEVAMTLPFVGTLLLKCAKCRGDGVIWEKIEK